MGVLFDQYPGKEMKGSEITISASKEMLFVSERDEVFLYTGICVNEEYAQRKGLDFVPFMMDGLHSTDRKISGRIRNFYRISDGCIYLENYVDDFCYKDKMFKQIVGRVHLSKNCTDYGVVVDHQEDTVLTRAVFGLTFRELSELVAASTKVLSRYGNGSWFPRLTRSLHSDNHCELTGAWIPAKFPYIAFSESGYDFSHVSVWGFYRLIQLLTYRSLDSKVSKEYMDVGIDKDLLNRVFRLGYNFYESSICRFD